MFGRCFRFSMSEIAGHLSFIFLAISFGLKDMFWLRILALCAGISMMCFNFWHPHGKVQWLPFKWNATFVLINLAHILYLLNNEYRVRKLTKEEMILYEDVFSHTGLDKINFMRLLRVGKWEEHAKGELLTHEGRHSNLVRLIHSGSARVMVKHKSVYTLSHGQFIGEMGLHVGLHITSPVQSTASVVCETPVRSVVWSRGALIDLLESFPEIAGAVQAAISADLVRKALDRDSQQNIVLAHESSVARRKAKTLADVEDVEEVVPLELDNGMEVSPEVKKSIEIGDKQVSIQRAWIEKDLTMYQQLLLSVLNDGKVSNHEKGTLRRFRQIHFITDAEHKRILNRVGWSEEEYEQGFRREQAEMYQAELKKQHKGPYSMLARLIPNREALPVLNNPFDKDGEDQKKEP